MRHPRCSALLIRVKSNNPGSIGGDDRPVHHLQSRQFFDMIRDEVLINQILDMLGEILLLRFQRSQFLFSARCTRCVHCRLERHIGSIDVIVQVDVFTLERCLCLHHTHRNGHTVRLNEIAEPQLRSVFRTQDVLRVEQSAPELVVLVMPR